MQKFSNISIHVRKNVPYTFSRDTIHLTVLINLESYSWKVFIMFFFLVKISNYLDFTEHMQAFSLNGAFPQREYI